MFPSLMWPNVKKETEQQSKALKLGTHYQKRYQDILRNCQAAYYKGVFIKIKDLKLLPPNFLTVHQITSAHPWSNGNSHVLSIKCMPLCLVAHWLVRTSTTVASGLVLVAPVLLRESCRTQRQLVQMRISHTVLSWRWPKF